MGVGYCMWAEQNAGAESCLQIPLQQVHGCGAQHLPRSRPLTSVTSAQCCDFRGRKNWGISGCNSGTPLLLMPL